jgi:hypothetical protein
MVSKKGTSLKLVFGFKGKSRFKGFEARPRPSRDMVFIEPKRKLPPQGGRTLKGRGKKRREKEEKRKRGKSRTKSSPNSTNASTGTSRRIAAADAPAL